jgi:hypothetical protein
MIFSPLSFDDLFFKNCRICNLKELHFIFPDSEVKKIVSQTVALYSLARNLQSLKKKETSQASDSKVSIIDFNFFIRIISSVLMKLIFCRFSIGHRGLVTDMTMKMEANFPWNCMKSNSKPALNLFSRLSALLLNSFWQWKIATLLFPTLLQL